MVSLNCANSFDARFFLQLPSDGDGRYGPASGPIYSTPMMFPRLVTNARKSVSKFSEQINGHLVNYQHSGNLFGQGSATLPRRCIFLYVLELEKAQWFECELTDREVCGPNPTSASRILLPRFRQTVNFSAVWLASNGMTVWHRKGILAKLSSDSRFQGK
ncbi:hypothetical protein CSKR_108448 [Clonorchis sinensis]|uniref:Uncharacterized protein n=1 Tax=Clonorchis sinensis TaxID=79923 RepID=A0A419PV23_CLOSI|nr:hypothetical protein CSKR_108448 [Clonorchis sinensis]